MAKLFWRDIPEILPGYLSGAARKPLRKKSSVFNSRPLKSGPNWGLGAVPISFSWSEPDFWACWGWGHCPILDATFLLTFASFLLAVELFYIQLCFLAFLLTVGATCLQFGAFVLTVGALLSKKQLNGL